MARKSKATKRKEFLASHRTRVGEHVKAEAKERRERYDSKVRKQRKV